MKSCAIERAPWPTVRLDDLATRGSGHTPNKRVPQYWDGDVRWVSLKDTFRLNRRYITDTSSRITEEGLAHSSAVLHPRGSVVLLRDAGVGNSGILGHDMAVSQHFIAWACGEELDSQFLYYVLQGRKEEFERISNGSTIKTIGLDHFRRLTVPLPPLPEQKRIAAALSDADELIIGLERLIAKKQAIKQGMMQQLLTGQTRLPGFTEKWRTVDLGELGAFIKGTGIKRDDVRRSGVPCIRYGEIYTRYRNYTSETASFVGERVASEALPIRFGDILFAGSGETRDEIGLCIAFIGRESAVAGGDIVILRGRDFNPVFLACAANTPGVASQKARLGQGDAVVHISGRALASIEIDLPQKQEQDAIAEVVLDVDAEIDLLTERLVKARAVKQGMMQELLTGRTRRGVAEGAE